MSILRDLMQGRIPFTRKDDETFLVTYIQTKYYKDLDVIDRIPEKEQRAILDQLIGEHRRKWYFTFKVAFVALLILVAWAAMDQLFGRRLVGEEFILDMFVKTTWSISGTFIVFYTFKHYDLWRIASSDETKQLIHK